MFKCSVKCLCPHYLELEDYGLDNICFHNITRPPCALFLNTSSVGLALFLWNRLFPLWASLSVWGQLPVDSGATCHPGSSLGSICDAFLSQSHSERSLWGGGRPYISGNRAVGWGGDDPHMMLFSARNVMIKENFQTERSNDTENSWNGSRGISGTSGVFSCRIVPFPVVAIWLSLEDGLTDPLVPFWLFSYHDWSNREGVRRRMSKRGGRGGYHIHVTNSMKSEWFILKRS